MSEDASDDLKNARIVLKAYDELVDALRAENAMLRRLLQEIHDNAYPGKAFATRINAAFNGSLARGSIQGDER